MTSCLEIHGAKPHSAGERAILDAALRLFSENGFDGVSMRAVAQEAGVSKSNIYHHFESKEALYLAILKASADSLSEMVEALAEGAGEFDARLRKFARAHLAHLFEQAATVRLFLRELFSEEMRLQKMLVEQVIGGIFERMISIFTKGQEAGLLRPGLDPGLCAFLILGADLFYFQSHSLRQYSPLDKYAHPREQFSEEMMNIVLHGMLVQPVSGRVER